MPRARREAAQSLHRRLFRHLGWRGPRRHTAPAADHHPNVPEAAVHAPTTISPLFEFGIEFLRLCLRHALAELFENRPDPRH